LAALLRRYGLYSSNGTLSLVSAFANTKAHKNNKKGAENTLFNVHSAPLGSSCQTLMARIKLVCGDSFLRYKWRRAPCALIVQLSHSPVCIPTRTALVVCASSALAGRYSLGKRPIPNELNAYHLATLTHHIGGINLPHLSLYFLPLDN
jgi:hypothetical protein